MNRPLVATATTILSRNVLALFPFSSLSLSRSRLLRLPSPVRVSSISSSRGYFSTQTSSSSSPPSSSSRRPPMPGRLKRTGRANASPSLQQAPKKEEEGDSPFENGSRSELKDDSTRLQLLRRRRGSLSLDRGNGSGHVADIATDDPSSTSSSTSSPGEDDAVVPGRLPRNTRRRADESSSSSSSTNQRDDDRDSHGIPPLETTTSSTLKSDLSRVRLPRRPTAPLSREGGSAVAAQSATVRFRLESRRRRRRGMEHAAAEEEEEEGENDNDDYRSKGKTAGGNRLKTNPSEISIPLIENEEKIRKDGEGEEKLLLESSSSFQERYEKLKHRRKEKDDEDGPAMEERENKRDDGKEKEGWTFFGWLGWGKR